MDNATKNTTSRLEHLFDAELFYQEHMDALVGPDGREGDLIGSGDGTVTGTRLSGALRWSMYSGNCAYLLVKAGIEPDQGRHLCTVNPAGIIQTHDDARIWFDAKGFGLRGYDPERPHLWRLAMSARFETDDDRYAWLDSVFATWHGLFNERRGTATYKAYVQHTG